MFLTKMYASEFSHFTYIYVHYYKHTITIVLYVCYNEF